MRTLATLRILPLLVAPFSVAASPSEGPLLEGEMFAQVSVTVDPDDSGTIHVPSPFVVMPERGQAAINVPESGGILLFEGERIVHHFPYRARQDVVRDLESSSGLLVSGALLTGRTTVGLHVYDLETGRSLQWVESANPHLRIDGEGSDLWRVVIEGARVGIFHPPAGASYPLWERGRGIVPSTEQMSGAQAGIGLGGGVAWIPQLHGPVVRQVRGKTTDFTNASDGDFLDAVSDSAVLLLQPTSTVRADADGELLLERELKVRVVDETGARFDFRLRSMSAHVDAKRLVIAGRPVRVVGGHVYWIYLGYDYLEIRRAPTLRGGSGS